MSKCYTAKENYWISDIFGFNLFLKQLLCDSQSANCCEEKERKTLPFGIAYLKKGHEQVYLGQWQAYEQLAKHKENDSSTCRTPGRMSHIQSSRLLNVSEEENIHLFVHIFTTTLEEGRANLCFVVCSQCLAQDDVKITKWGCQY